MAKAVTEHHIAYRHFYCYKRSLMTAILFLLFSSCIMAQDINKTISIKAKNISLAEFISLVSTQSGLHFSYSSQQIPVNTIINVSVKIKKIADVLHEVLTPLGIEYVLVENQIVLKIIPGLPDNYHKGKLQPDGKKKYTLSGYMKDALSGEVLTGANIYTSDTYTGTSSNEYGFYSFSLPEGRYLLKVSFVGYQTLNDTVILNKNISKNYQLPLLKMNIPEVLISAEDNLSDKAVNFTESIRISPLELDQLPGFAGDIDIVKAMQSVPGIRTYGDASANFYVRGGNRDQNLILVDDAPLYNPSHLFGFFSAITPDAIRDMNVYKNNFPFNAGGRLASVIDIRIKDGNMKRFGFSGNLGPYTSYLTFEGPFKKDVASFFISGRISNLNWLAKTRLSNSKKLKINFFDLNAKFNVIVNKNNRLYISMYGGQDIFSRNIRQGQSTFGVTWNNILGSIRWNHIYNDRLFSNTTVYYSRYNYFLYLSKESDNYWKSSVSNISLKSDYSYFPDPSNTIRTGIRASLYFMDPGNVHFGNPDIQQNIKVIPDGKCAEVSVYAGNEQLIGEKISLEYGFALPVWMNFGPTTVYRFNTAYQLMDSLNYGQEVYHTSLAFDPRFSFFWQVNKKTVLNFKYSRTSQFIQIISNSISPLTSMEVWLPAGPNIHPQACDEFSTGYQMVFKKPAISVSADAYYRQYYKQVDYKDHANLLYNPLIEGELRFGKTQAYGIELMFRRYSGKFTGWISYTFSRAIRQTDGVNSGNPYPADFDSPNNLFVNLTFKTNKHWVFSANWMYLTGNPYTLPVSFYYFNGYSVPVYGSKNNGRLPDYHRLDIAITYNINKPSRKYQHALELNLYNVYARANAISMNFNKIIDDKGNFVVPADLQGNYEIVPSVISVAGIIPSINYKFSF